jgi:hypothetical protein
MGGVRFSMSCMLVRYRVCKKHLGKLDGLTSALPDISDPSKSLLRLA